MRVRLAVAILALAVSPALAGPAPSEASTPGVSASPSASPASSASPAPSASPPPSASPTPAGPLLVRGQILTIGGGYCIFTTGDAVRVSPGLSVPKGVMTGSLVRVTIDPATRAVTALELEPKIDLAGEIDAAKIPRQFVVVSPKSAPLPAPSATGGAGASGPVTVTILVHVPGNTPTSDTVYLSTDRSSYNPSEVPMQRVDGTTFKAAVTLPAGTALRYTFTRGTYATVERDRTGGIVSPRALGAAPGATTDDTVLRWADLS